MGGGDTEVWVDLISIASYSHLSSTFFRLFFLGIFGIGGSALLYYYALQRLGATVATSLFVPTSTISGALFAFVFLAEPLGMQYIDIPRSIE